MTTTKIPVEFLNALSGTEITDGSIGTADIADSAITTAKIAANAITATQLPDNVITATHIPNGLITGTHMAGTTLTATQIANNAIGTDQLAGIARGKIIYGDSNGDPQLLTVGSANQVLISDGADISWGTNTHTDTTKLPLAGGTMTGDIAHAGNFTLDVGGEIRLSADDNGEIHLYDGSLHYGSLLEDNSNLIIQSIVQDEDILFKGDDDSDYIATTIWIALIMPFIKYIIFRSFVLFPWSPFTKKEKMIILLRKMNAVRAICVGILIEVMKRNKK